MPPVVALLAVCLHPALGYEPKISLADLNRFPCQEAAWQGWKFAWEHKNWLETRHPFSDTALELDSWKAEHRHYLAAWDALADSWGPVGYALPEGNRLEHLRRLRQVLGRDAYWKGAMPPACPWWRFTLVD